MSLKPIQLFQVNGSRLRTEVNSFSLARLSIEIAPEWRANRKLAGLEYLGYFRIADYTPRTSRGWALKKAQLR